MINLYSIEYIYRTTQTHLNMFLNKKPPVVMTGAFTIIVFFFLCICLFHLRINIFSLSHCARDAKCCADSS